MSLQTSEIQIFKSFRKCETASPYVFNIILKQTPGCSSSYCVCQDEVIKPGKQSNVENSSLLLSMLWSVAKDTCPAGIFSVHCTRA